MGVVDLDRLVAGCSAISWRAWDGVPGVVVGVRALSSIQWAEAMRTAAERVPAKLSGRARELSVRHESAVEIVSRCVFVRDDSDAAVPMLTLDDARALDADSLISLHRMVALEQSAAHGASLAYADVSKAIEGDTHSLMDKARAIHAAGLHGFYGMPAIDLTDWQVTIYLHLLTKKD